MLPGGCIIPCYCCGNDGGGQPPSSAFLDEFGNAGSSFGPPSTMIYGGTSKSQDECGLNPSSQNVFSKVIRDAEKPVDALRQNSNGEEDADLDSKNGKEEDCVRGASLTSSTKLGFKIEDSDLVRAVTLTPLLRGFGRHFRANALADVVFSAEEAELLFGLSRKVDRIGEFLSHSWRGSAFAKYLALCLHFNSAPANVVACLVALAVFFLGLFDILPSWTVEQTFGVPLSFWSSFLGAFTYLLALVTWHHMPASVGGGRSCAVFFDKLCVHQYKQDLKEAGIRSFAAFIARSDRFLVLWSPDYFARLWCTLELAAYLKLQKEADENGMSAPRKEGHASDEAEHASSLVFRPLQLATVTVSCLVSAQTLFLAIALWAWIQNELDLPRGLFNPIVCMIIFGSLPFYVAAMRKYVRDHDALQGQIKEFSVESASCYSPDDRQLVYETIKEWFGDLATFNRFVQTNVAKDIATAVPDSRWYPLRLSCCALACSFFFGLDWLQYYTRVFDVSPDASVAGILQLFVYPVLLEMVQTLTIQIVNRPFIKKRRHGSGKECLASLLVGEGVAFLMGVIYWCATVCRDIGVVAIGVYLLALIGFSAALRFIGIRTSKGE
jgi:hypothetical protein